MHSYERLLVMIFSLFGLFLEEAQHKIVRSCLKMQDPEMRDNTENSSVRSRQYELDM